MYKRDDKKGRLKTLEMQMLEADLWPKKSAQRSLANASLFGDRF